MRRTDREITDRGKIDAIIRRCDCCRLALSDEEAPYIVPLNFGFTYEDGRAVFYFHGAAEGRKLALLRRHPRVGFELDTGHALHAAETACGYAYAFQSVIGVGTVTTVTDAAQKRAALQCLMAHYSDRADWTFDDNMVSAVTVLRLEVETMSCKEHE